MMKKTLFIIFLLLLSVSGQAKLNIVTTTSDLASIAQSIGGDYVAVKSLQSGKRDPHFLQAKPSYIMKAKQADLWICIGMELEIGYESVILEKARNVKIMRGQPGYLDASKTVMVLGKPKGKIDRSMGDVHSMGNPHYWLDPYNGRQMAIAISERLQQHDPEHQAQYVAQTQLFCDQLASAFFGDALLANFSEKELWENEKNGTLSNFLEASNRVDQLGGWKAKMASLSGIGVATYHKSWIYFLNRFGLTTVIELEPKPGIPPSPAHLANVISIMQEKKVPLLIMEPYYLKSHADVVVRKTKAQLVMVANATHGQKEAKNYIQMLNHVVQQVTTTLDKVGK